MSKVIVHKRNIDKDVDTRHARLMAKRLANRPFQPRVSGPLGSPDHELNEYIEKTPEIIMRLCDEVEHGRSADVLRQRIKELQDKNRRLHRELREAQYDLAWTLGSKIVKVAR